jgi:D-lyxose ketol-isomerase
MEISRRAVLGGLMAGVGAGLSRTNVANAAEQKPVAVKKYRNEDFYVGGTFNADAAKKAYFEMFERFNYPIYERLKTDEFWTLDFGLGKFTEVGMAGIFWVNNKKDNYFGHEIYLLPGQMIPEHKHVKTADAGPKMEAWQPRYGWIYIYGEGAPTPEVEARIPESHKECAVARTEKKLLPGEVGMLAGAEQWHWMLAPEGAIVTEYATYHDGNGLRFSHPKAKL